MPKIYFLIAAFSLIITEGKSEPTLWGLGSMHLFERDQAFQKEMSISLSGEIDFVREHFSGAEYEKRFNRWAQQGIKVVPVYHAGPEYTKKNDYDLRKVYQNVRDRAFPNVFAIEGLNEPELHFFNQLPDRAASLHKAIYLGALHSKNRINNEPLYVLGPSFPHPATTRWQKVFITNSGHTYSDAHNIHYYGWLSSLSQFIEGHRKQFAGNSKKKRKPIWMTEVNIGRSSSKEYSDTTDRAMQADYLVTATKIAMNENVSAFAPFALRWKLNDAFSLFDEEGRPYSGWSKYSKLVSSKTNPEKSAKFDRVETLSPIVIQWIANESTTNPNKHNGSYRFLPSSYGDGDLRPIEGIVRIYNLSNETIKGKFKIRSSDMVSIIHLNDSINQGVIEIPPIDVVKFPLRISSKKTGYFEGFVTVEFQESPLSPHLKTKAPSILYFPIEARPTWTEFKSLPISLARTIPTQEAPQSLEPRETPTLPIWIENDHDPALARSEDLAAASIKYLQPRYTFHDRTSKDTQTSLTPTIHKTGSILLTPVPSTQKGRLDWHNRDYPYGYEWTTQSGIWSGMNRLVAEDLGIEAGTFARLSLTLDALHPHSQKKPRAVCKVSNGLPEGGWLGLISNRSFDAFFNVQVFLIDRWGQRWTIDEQLVSNPHLCGIEKFLKLADFDKTYFGNIIPGAVFDARDVVEIQLHPHGLENLNHPIEIALTIMRPKEVE